MSRCIVSVALNSICLPFRRLVEMVLRIVFKEYYYYNFLMKLNICKYSGFSIILKMFFECRYEVWMLYYDIIYKRYMKYQMTILILIKKDICNNSCNHYLYDICSPFPTNDWRFCLKQDC